MPGAKMNDRIRAEVVVRLAAWEAPSQVQRWLREEHGIEVGLPALTRYNFDNPESRSTGTEKWIRLFDEARERAKKEISDIPTAHKAVRMRIRDQQIMKLNRKETPNIPLLNELLEAQAKEDGGMFTNRRELTGKGGGPIQTEDVALTDEERAQRVAQLLDKARARAAEKG